MTNVRQEHGVTLRYNPELRVTLGLGGRRLRRRRIAGGLRVEVLERERRREEQKLGGEREALNECVIIYLFQDLSF